MSRRAACALAAALVLHAGCSSLSERECRDANWQKIGQEDGAAGRVEQLPRHRQSCAALGIAPDEARYAEGYRPGLGTYCTPAGAYQSGRRGAGYREELCPQAQVEALARPVREGRRVYDVLVQLSDCERFRDEVRMAALSREYGAADQARLQMRMHEVEFRCRRLRWDAELQDRRWAEEFGAPPLTEFDFRR